MASTKQTNLHPFTDPPGGPDHAARRPVMQARIPQARAGHAGNFGKGGSIYLKELER